MEKTKLLSAEVNQARRLSNQLHLASFQLPLPASRESVIISGQDWTDSAMNIFIFSSI